MSKVKKSYELPCITKEDEERRDKINNLSDEIEKLNSSLKVVHYEYFEEQLRVLSGKILTIIDASISDKQQNKCVKDLIKSEVYRRIYDLQEFYKFHEQGIGSVNCIDLDDRNAIPFPLN